MQWEVGKPDYLGAAASENILRKIDESITSEQIPVVSTELTEEEKHAKARWEQGQPDYMGISSTENILQKLDTIVGRSSREGTPEK